jgi:hypothetical protein
MIDDTAALRLGEHPIHPIDDTRVLCRVDRGDSVVLVEDAAAVGGLRCAGAAATADEAAAIAAGLGIGPGLLVERGRAIVVDGSIAEIVARDVAAGRRGFTDGGNGWLDDVPSFRIRARPGDGVKIVDGDLTPLLPPIEVRFGLPEGTRLLTGAEIMAAIRSQTR